MISIHFCHLLSPKGESVSLADLLNAREQRAILQQNYLKTYQQTLLSVTLVAVGEVKKSPLLDTLFTECLAELTACFAQLGVTPLTQFSHSPHTGHEAFFVLPIEAVELKLAMIALEDRTPLARLWDLDVFDKQGNLISRTALGYAARSCLLCEQEAKICARQRSHTISAILLEMQQRIWSEIIAKLAYQALLDEVYLTPKPGLVDRQNNGAHHDMSVATFERSASALRPYFARFVRLGMAKSTLSLSQLFTQIRPLGIEAEQAMKSATEGINTHKGAIFSFGLICSVLGWLTMQEHFSFYREKGETTQWEAVIGSLVAQMTKGLCDELHNPSTPITAGIQLFQQYGLTGARGEAERGFPLVQQAVQLLRKYAYLETEHRLLIALVHLLATNQDTNLAHRGGLEGLSFVQQQAFALLQNTDVADKTMLIATLRTLDTACIQRNLSAGGSADLLALAWFFILLEHLLFTS